MTIHKTPITASAETMAATSKQHTRTVSRRSVVAAGSLAALTPTLLAACGGNEGAGNGGATELTFMNQSRGQEAALTALAEKYSEENGITITIDSPGPADYLPRLQSRAQSRDMPDIYSAFNATDMAPFYKAGWATNFSAELDAGWKDSFSPAVLELSTFDESNNLDVEPGVYTVHWETQTYGILVNPELTGIPAGTEALSGEELIDALVSAPNAKGSFSVAASLVPQLLQGLASNWLTDEEIIATLNGQTSWEDQAWQDAFQFLVDLQEAEVIANSALPGGQDDNPSVEADFFTQSLGAIFDASPGIAVGHSTNPDFDSYFSLPIPSLPGGTQAPRSPGVPGKGAVINPRGKDPEAALAFVKWLTEPEQQAYFAQEALTLPTHPELLSAGNVPEQLAGFARGAETVQLMADTFTVDVKTAITAESQRVVLGEVTVAEALATIQAAQERTA